jgi:non-heme chloroperoxidase
MKHTLQPQLFRRLVCAVLLAGACALASAAGREFMVTAPDGVQLAVQESGNPDGPAIVFIHGLLGSRIDWDRQTTSPGLQRYRMISYDLRGHGLSDKPDDVEAYRDGRRYADDLATVLKAVNVKRPVLVGWSLGGVVISNYLAAYGDAEIGGAIYVDGVIELDPKQIVSHPQEYAGLASHDLKTHLDAMRRFVRLCFYTQPDKVTMERLLTNAAMASWIMTRTVPSMTVAAADGLPKAMVPVLLLYGARDALVMPQPAIARARALNQRIQVKLYEDSGHAPFIEETSRFNRDLAQFADSVR